MEHGDVGARGSANRSPESPGLLGEAGYSRLGDGGFAAPDGTFYFGLHGLEAGTYTVVCFVDVPEGIPHDARGMIADFTVQ